MAAPILERQTDTQGVLVLPIEFGSDFIATERRVVTDCPGYAWDESDLRALFDLRTTFGEDLVRAYETDLKKAGHKLIETHLAVEWRNRGFAVAFVYDKSAYEDGATPGPDGTAYAVPADEVYHQVWQAAANAITDKDLVREADLGQVFGFRTELEQHRAALHHRLDEWASSDMCDRAEQQLDGLRAAVDNAVTRAQLIKVSARVDQLITPIA